MKRAMGHAALSASLLGRLSGFDMADLGPHASLLYRELITSASAGLPGSTIILAAAIVDIGRWLAGDAERAVIALLDYLDDLQFSD